VLEGDNPYATAMHEIGHILSPCEGPTHFRARRTYACIQCEIDAWRKGMALALVWTEGMHDWLRSSLATYARSTVGVLGTLDELHRLSSGHGYREERLRRMLADHERQVQAVTAARWHHD
jgi:hypothetical protein